MTTQIGNVSLGTVVEAVITRRSEVVETAYGIGFEVVVPGQTVNKGARCAEGDESRYGIANTAVRGNIYVVWRVRSQAGKRGIGGVGHHGSSRAHSESADTVFHRPESGVESVSPSDVGSGMCDV